MNDNGPHPHIINIEDATKNNDTFRTALWTGKYLQLTVMSIKPGEDVGLEVHDDHDQFIRVEQGVALVKMGQTNETLDFTEEARHDDAVFIPAGMWHNIVNSGDEDLKLYSIYSPPEHAHGTVHHARSDDPEHAG